MLVALFLLYLILLRRFRLLFQNFRFRLFRFLSPPVLLFRRNPNRRRRRRLGIRVVRLLDFVARPVVAVVVVVVAVA